MSAESIDHAAWLLDAADNPAVSWSVGAFGALAEFHREEGEDAEIHHADGVTSIATARGAISYSVPDGARLVAYEGLSKKSTLWSQGLSLCMEASAASRQPRSALTLLGPDADAIDSANRDSVLLDLGINCAHIRACIRTRDTGLLGALRPHLGTSLFAEDSPVMDLLQEANPHRVFISEAARIEVYVPIPPEDGVSPMGPHTHLLPDLLAHERPFAANVPIEDGWLPVLNAYPPNPARDSTGDPRRFDAADHATFQRLYDAFGRPDLVQIKRQLAEIVRNEGLHAVEMPDGRFERTAARVALRQLF